MKFLLPRLCLVAATLALAACGNTILGASPDRALDKSQEYDHVLSCKLKQDEPMRCETQAVSLCPKPDNADVHKTRTVDPVDNAVTYVYQVRCGK
ncbi:hypothetical protein [Comamonas composti]|uniref:hypothetical protein n=1 Tax=Comamonas composti TaxID=408558 RepID=UPI00041FD56D|nr:hypothetical protein [Comamonas composti]